jgi:RND superfamily putative drug exporter
MSAALAAFRTQALATGLVREPFQVALHPAQRIVEISVPLAGAGSDETSVRALDALRQDVVPAAFGDLPDTRAYVTGELAFSQDFNAQLERSIAPVIVFVLVMAFVLMLVAFRSVTVAVVSVLLTVVSMAAAFGVMVAVFQHGWAAGLVQARGVGAIESWIPLFAFVILFGLSMDYQVFVVSRIREAYDRGMGTKQAIAHGITISAGVVTSAAAIMVGVFAVFGTLSMTDFKQLGVGLAVAILLDATVVRAVLLPSVLTLLGDRTWWLPRWLSFLPAPTVSQEEPTPVTLAPAEPVLTAQSGPRHG